MSIEQDKGRVVLLAQEELEAGAKLFPPDAVSIGGLARVPSGRGGPDGAVDEPAASKCTTHIYYRGHDIHMAEVCGGGEAVEIVSDTIIGSV